MPKLQGSWSFLCLLLGASTKEKWAVVSLDQHFQNVLGWRFHLPDKDASPGGPGGLWGQGMLWNYRIACYGGDPLQTTMLRLWECFSAACVLVLRGSRVWDGDEGWRSRDQWEPCKLPSSTPRAWGPCLQSGSGLTLTHKTHLYHNHFHIYI